jgi:hypothetical protein
VRAGLAVVAERRVVEQFLDGMIGKVLHRVLTVELAGWQVRPATIYLEWSGYAT